MSQNHTRLFRQLKYIRTQWRLQGLDGGTGAAERRLGNQPIQFLLGTQGVPDEKSGVCGLPPSMVSPRERSEFDPAHAQEFLRRHFKLHSLDGLGIEPEDRSAVGAAGALLQYAVELQPAGLPQIARPTVRRPGGIVPLDEMTRRNLELTEPLRADVSGYS